jgi:hypothetical protein
MLIESFFDSLETEALLVVCITFFTFSFGTYLGLFLNFGSEGKYSKEGGPPSPKFI